MYGPYLKIDEINAKYPNALVLLADPTSNRYHQLTGGHVVFHAPDRAAFDRQFDAWQDPAVKRLAFHWTGAVTGEDAPAVSAEPEPGAA